jgi:two-component system chemotaxis sensor kinase CheA
MEEMEDILEDFLVEAFEMIEQLDQDLVELENSPEDLDLLNRIFRVAHTIKGSSSFLNFDVLTKLTHHMEDVLNKARKSELVITPDIMDVVLESIDMMKELLEYIRDNKTDQDSHIDITDIVVRLDTISSGGELSEVESSPAPAQDEDKQDSDFDMGEELDYSSMSGDEMENEIERLLQIRQAEDKAKREAKKKGGDAPKKEEPKKEEPKKEEPKEVKKEEPKKETPAEAPKPPAPVKKEPPKPKPAKAPTVEQTIRVDVKRLDHLMNLIGELVLGKNRLLKIYNDVEERYEGEQFLEELNQVVSSISLVTTDLQIAVMKTRMLPVGKVFNKFPRMVRDLSRELSKKMELVITGEETELDKSIVEEIGDPLVHIIRNSCDHGIESPATRTEAGKSETGTIELKAYNEGNHIVIEIADDGKGIPPDKLKEKALKNGLITQREAENMTDKDALTLIFRAGFSTAEQVTNVSGRGVGMDVVKTNIEKLNGIIDVDSDPGKGSVMKLKIPLTLAIIQALLVGVQEEYYAIPIASVLETVRISFDEISSVEGRSVLRLRNEVLPLVKLGDIFGVENIIEATEHVYVVVIGLAEKKIGVIVDNLVGQEEIVIKSLGDYLKGIEGIAGATIRGDGKVTLIIDIAALMQLAKNIKVNIAEQQIAQVESKSKSSPSDYNVLIVDDSKTDRSIMKKSLEPTGVTIKEATNGVDALNVMKSDEGVNVDLILIDIEMPRMDGYTLASEIRKYNRFKNLPLIACTSRTSKSDRMRGVEVGMTEYITKPYSPEYLANVVKKNLNLG